MFGDDSRSVQVRRRFTRPGYALTCPLGLGTRCRSDDHEERCWQCGETRGGREGGRATEVPEIYQVVVECRHEREQQAVFERMRGEGYRCRVLTL